MSQSLQPASVLLSGPLLSPSGYGEESRNFLIALHQAGVPVAGQILPWPGREVDLGSDEAALLKRLIERPVRHGFVQIVQEFAPRIASARHPDARLVVGRTMFETDRLPPDWVVALNQLDGVWVPSEFNRQTFAQSGVDLSRIRVLPGCFDPRPYGLGERPKRPKDRPFTFVSVFDWSLHKGWDVLIRAYKRGFAGRKDVHLLLKAWSSLGYTQEQMVEQAMRVIRDELGIDPESEPSKSFRTAFLDRDDVLALYREADAFALPSRGEGWGRPYAEAMMSGLPTIGTGWSGNTQFMSEENSWLLPYRVVPTPEPGWNEVAAYRGHQWAEPDEDALIAAMRGIGANPGSTRARAERGRLEVVQRYSREAVGTMMAGMIDELRNGKAA